MILTKSGAQEYLRNLKTFKNLYSDIENQYNQQATQLTDAARISSNQLGSFYGLDRISAGSQYQGNMNDVIANAAQSRANIFSASTSMGSGARNQSMSDLERATAAAYDVYAKNLGSSILGFNQNLTSDKINLETNLATSINELEQQKYKSNNEVDKLIDEEAVNYANIWNAPMEYLQTLVEKGIITHDNPAFSKFFDVTYVNGSPEYSLKTDKWFESNFYELDNAGNYTNRLSDTGKDFYRQMLYGTSDINGVPSFESWLKDKDQNLWEWASSASYDDKYSRNLEAVFGGADIDVNDQKYVARDLDAYKIGTTPEVYNSTYFGEVERYKGNETINVMNDLTLSNANLEDIGNDEAESFSASWTDKGGNIYAYDFKVKKDAEKASDDIINDIVSKVKNIENGKIYTYGDKVYIATVTDNKITMRELTITKNADTFWEQIKVDTLREGLESSSDSRSGYKIRDVNTGAGVLDDIALSQMFTRMKYSTFEDFWKSYEDFEYQVDPSFRNVETAERKKENEKFKRKMKNFFEQSGFFPHF